MGCQTEMAKQACGNQSSPHRLVTHGLSQQRNRFLKIGVSKATAGELNFDRKRELKENPFEDK